MILTLTIKLAYSDDDWKVTIEIDDSSSLEDLHLAIQDAVEFDNDHMYEFYVARTEHSHNRDVFDSEDDGVYNITLESLYPLPKARKLYYMFDYGDSWLFQVTKSRKKPHETINDIEYPRVINETGKKPEQYPDWEE
jgi:hypothetical protein